MTVAFSVAAKNPSLAEAVTLFLVEEISWSGIRDGPARFQTRRIAERAAPFPGRRAF
jgi:hypothetical protein